MITLILAWRTSCFKILSSKKVYNKIKRKKMHVWYTPTTDDNVDKKRPCLPPDFPATAKIMLAVPCYFYEDPLIAKEKEVFTIAAAAMVKGSVSALKQSYRIFGYAIGNLSLLYSLPIVSSYSLIFCMRARAILTAIPLSYSFRNKVVAYTYSKAESHLPSTATEWIAHWNALVLWPGLCSRSRSWQGCKNGCEVKG